MARPSKYPTELRERAVRLVIEVRGDHPSESAAIKSVAAKLGITSPEQLRKWLRQAEIDGGARQGKTTDDIAEIKKLKKENAELRRANEILKAASAFFASFSISSMSTVPRGSQSGRPGPTSSSKQNNSSSLPSLR